MRAREREEAPAWPILLSLKSKLVREEFAARAMEIAAAPASCIPVRRKFTSVRDEMSRCSPKLQTKRVLRLSLTLEHSNKHSQANLIYDLRSSAELIFLAMTINNDTAVSSLREAMMPLMNKKTCLSLSKYLLSSTTEVKSLSLLIT